MNNEEQLNKIFQRFDILEREIRVIEGNIFKRLQVSKVETDESVPKVLQITKISETPEGLYIRVR